MHHPTNSLLRFLALLAPKMWLIEGNERRTGKRLAMIWCGPVAQQAYMLNRIFGAGIPRRRYVGRRPMLLLRYLLRKYDCQLGVLAGPGKLLARIREAGDIEVSWWINSELNIDAAMDPANRSRSLKDDLRRVRNNELEYRCVTDFESYRYFYDDFYLPSVIDSHGAAALPTEFDTRWNIIRKGEAELIWVTRSGEPISGMVICYDGSIPILRDIGIKGGDKSLRKTGAVTAAYYFAIRHLQSRGFDRVRLGFSRPFLNDGVLGFKQKWHPELTETSAESFLIRMNDLCDASRSFLRTCSFVGEEEGELQFTLIAANDDDFRIGGPELDRLAAIYGINSRSYIDVSGRRPKVRRAS